MGSLLRTVFGEPRFRGIPRELREMIARYVEEEVIIANYRVRCARQNGLLHGPCQYRHFGREVVLGTGFFKEGLKHGEFRIYREASWLRKIQVFEEGELRSERIMRRKGSVVYEGRWAPFAPIPGGYIRRVVSSNRVIHRKYRDGREVRREYWVRGKAGTWKCCLTVRFQEEPEYWVCKNFPTKCDEPERLMFLDTL